VRHHDQEEPEAGELICRLAQSGETGDWMAEDGDGNQLMVRTGSDGALEILHHPASAAWSRVSGCRRSGCLSSANARAA
jgi:hypothetical protein